jgi:hypothetical protein
LIWGKGKLICSFILGIERKLLIWGKGKLICYLNFEISTTNGGAILCSVSSTLSCASDVTTAPILAPVHDISPPLDVQLVLELKLWKLVAELSHILPSC